MKSQFCLRVNLSVCISIYVSPIICEAHKVTFLSLFVVEIFIFAMRFMGLACSVFRTFFTVKSYVLSTIFGNRAAIFTAVVLAQ
jgi:hypothetical protein